MSDALTLAEWLRVVIVTAGLLISAWALVDDCWDLVYVSRYGEIGGPRWVLATEHAWFNGTLLLGWLCALGALGIVIWLPARSDAGEDTLAQAASWLTLVFGACVLVSQAVRRAGRVALRALPLASWERMFVSVSTGMSTADRATLSARLLAATTAGREIGHLIANKTAPVVGLISLVLETAPGLSAQNRADLEEAQQHLLALAEQTALLHQEIKRQEGSA